MSRNRPPPADIRCEAPVPPASWNGNDVRCKNHSAVFIRGRKLCAKHAGSEALKSMLKSREAKLIMRPKSYMQQPVWAMRYVLDEECTLGETK